MKAAATSPKQGGAVATREHFTLSRSMEYFGEAELVRQCGHQRSDWPLVILKEALDNGLDGCESAGVAPKITISVDDEHLVISDNGAGIPPDVVKRICDFNSRTSDKSAYVSPSRGAMGNGSKLILAIPFALNGQGPTTTIIEACGVRHTITIDTDELRREPRIGRSEEQLVKTEGTRLRIPADSSCSQAAYRGAEFLQMVQDFALFNPHAEFTVDHFGERWERPALVPTRKWTPADPTSPHWYDPESFGTLIRSIIAAGETSGKHRPLREFIKRFRGLRGTAKQHQVSSAAGLKGELLRDLLDGQQKLRRDAMQALLKAMQEASVPVKPEALGVHGDEHFRRQLSSGDDSTFRYKRICGETMGRPFVVEAAFVSGQDLCGLTIGINSSVPLHNPLQQTMIGEVHGLASLLHELRIYFNAHPIETEQDDDEEGSDGWNTHRPFLALHLCYPGFSFVDQGKASLKLPPALGNAVGLAVTDVTKNWTKYQKAAERSLKQADRMEERFERSQRTAAFISQKNAAKQVVPEAYLHARGPTPAPVSARQIMYAARKRMEELCGKPLTGQYFSQTLLTDFVRQHPELTKDWDIVWDDRGHFEEPHRGRRIGIGTVAVREYLRNRPLYVYGGILFVEKEGFDETFKAYKLQERYDLAVMSSKGLSTVAARQIIEECSRQGVKIFCLHDFDVAGFTICAICSRGTGRYVFADTPEVIDIGLRLEDVRETGLDSEGVEIKGDPTRRLIRDGATPEEVEFLRGTRGVTPKGEIRFKGQRVELNAMTNPQLIEFVERKLKEHGVQKVIPPEPLLEGTFRSIVQHRKIDREMETVREAVEARVAEEMRSFKPPKGLRRKVADYFKRYPALSWHDVIGTLTFTEQQRK